MACFFFGGSFIRCVFELQIVHKMSPVWTSRNAPKESDRKPQELFGGPDPKKDQSAEVGGDGSRWDDGILSPTRGGGSMEIFFDWGNRAEGREEEDSGLREAGWKKWRGKWMKMVGVSQKGELGPFLMHLARDSATYTLI